MIRRMSVIQLLLRVRGGMQLYVKPVTGGTIKLTVRISDTVKAVKFKI